VRPVLFLLLAPAAHAQGTAECDRAQVLSAAGIGTLRIGITRDSLHRVCHVVRSRQGADYQVTIHDVRVGSDTVRVFERQGRVEWIEVDSPRFRTGDSLGAGTPAVTILNLPDVHGGPGDGTNTFALSPRSGVHCGLTFWLDPRTAEMLNAARGDRLRLLGMRGGGIVTQVDIHGECP